MISPSDIRNVEFDKGIKGYKTEAVDSFLDKIASDFDTLLNENKELESKLSVLAEKLEEYKSDEDSLREALLGAQKLGSNVIKEAKAKAEGIIRDATIESERILQENERKIEREKQAIVKLQKEVSDFKKRLMVTYKKHLEIINDIPGYEEPEKEETLQDVKEYMENGKPLPNEPMLERVDIYQKEDKKKKNKIADEAPTEESGHKDGDTIKFTINSQAKQENKEQPLIAKENIDNVEEKPHEENYKSSENRFGPLLFGDDYKIERNSK